jgi:hypothetical protein
MATLRGLGWALVTAVLGTLTLTTVASAAEVVVVEGEHEGKMRLPISYVERPLTLPPLILAPEIDFDVLHLGGGVGSSTNLTSLGFAVRMGIIENLEIRATVVNLTLTPSPVQFVGPAVGVTYRFLHGPVEIGASFDALFETVEPKGVALTPAIPVLAHLGKFGRIDTGVAIPISTQGPNVPGLLGGAPLLEGKASVGLEVPFRLSFDIVEPLHLGIATGFDMVTFNPPSGVSVGNGIYVPLGFFAGYAIGGRDGPIVDIDPFFTWPILLTPDAGGGGNAVNGGVWDVGIALTGYIYL